MAKDGFEVKFHFGAKKIKQRDVYIAALVLSLLVQILTKVLRLKPIQLWALIDEIGRHFKLRLINEIILQSPELLDARIERDVTNAIEEYKDVVDWEPVIVEEPTWTDQEEGETPLGGPLGFSYDFVEKEEPTNEQR